MKEKWINFLDHTAEFSLYLMIIQTPISKAGIEIFACLAILAFCLRTLLSKLVSLRAKRSNLNGERLLRHGIYTEQNECVPRNDTLWYKKILYAFLSKEFRSNPINFFLFCFIMFNALSLFNSGPYFKKSLIAFLFKWGEYFMLFFAIQGTFYNPKRIRNAIIIFLFMGIIVSIDGLSQYFLSIEFLRQKSLITTFQGNYAITAAFNHYNDFGIYITIILLMMLSLFIAGKKAPLDDNYKKWIVKSAYIPALILIETCLLFGFSRGSWLGFILGFFLMLLVSRKYKELTFISAIFIFTLIALPYTKIIKQRLDFIFKIGGDADRFIVWKTAFNMIKENPFLGKGIGTFMDYFSKRSGLIPQYAHNCFLQIWAETGIFSLLSFISFLAVLLWQGIAAFKKTDIYIILGMTCGLLAFSIHSFFDTHLYSLQLAVLFWTIAGILAAAIKVYSLRKN